MTGIEMSVYQIALQSLEQIKLEATASDRLWTEKVKTAFSKAGQATGFTVCASGVKPKYRDRREWLYDVTWLWHNKDSPGAPLIDCPLVLECEWGGLKDIVFDFEKLLLARASLRVLIFSSKNSKAPHRPNEKISLSQ